MKMHELLSDESKLCRTEMAMNADGVAVVSNHPDAVCWCILGAFDKCYDVKGVDIAEYRQNHDKLYQILEQVGYAGAVKAAYEMPFDQLHKLLKDNDL